MTTRNSTEPSEQLHQRARGRLRLTLKQTDQTRLDRLFQEGCLKARFPAPAAWHETVLLNTAGGVAGGDRLTLDIAAGPHTRATITTQAAERFYRALPGSTAHVRTALTVGPGAAMEWLPQETILFDRCALDRALVVDLALDCSFLCVEAFIFGRSAMGETVAHATLRDRIELRRAGRLVRLEATRIVGPVQPLLDRPASAGGARAVATLLYAAPDAAAHLDALRSALAPYDAGATLQDGVLAARMMAADGACLRRAVVAGLAVVRGGRPLPRVWEC